METARDRRCPACGHERFAWGYVVDLAPPGAPRDQRKKVGFTTKTDALDHMHRAQVEKAAGTYGGAGPPHLAASTTTAGAATPTGLRVDRQAGRGQRLQVPARGLDRDLELRGRGLGTL